MGGDGRNDTSQGGSRAGPVTEGVLSCFGGGSNSALALERIPRTSVLMSSLGSETTRKHIMAGTALIFANMQLKNVLPPARINEELAKTARCFRGVKTKLGHDFRSLNFLFLGMLFPANMPQDSKAPSLPLPCAPPGRCLLGKRPSRAAAAIPSPGAWGASLASCALIAANAIFTAPDSLITR